MLEGILLVDKPHGFTSFDVIAKLRGMTKTRRIGHAGTLDPMATGVLPVFFGRAAKAVDLLPNHDKKYIASMKLGIETDTQDITGKILSEKEPHVTAADFVKTMNGFKGELEQLPPMYSAVRVNGRRLYDIARSGGEVERKARKITVYSIELLEFDEQAGSYTIEVTCSRGTYIRTICHDIGIKLGCGAAMTALKRTTACGFELKDCYTLNQIQELAQTGALEEKLFPVDSVFRGLDRLILDEKQAKHFQNGLAMGLSQFEDLTGHELAVYDESSRFLGLARADTETRTLKIIKLFALGEHL